MRRPHSKMKNSSKFFAALAFSLTTLVSARAADIDGKWRAEFTSQIGEQKYVFELKSGADGKLTGKAVFERQNQKGEVELKDGKITKDEVSFVEPLKFQDQELKIEYKGKIVGDELKLHRKVGDIAAYDIVAKREKPAAK